MTDLPGLFGQRYAVPISNGRKKNPKCRPVCGIALACMAHDGVENNARPVSVIVQVFRHNCSWKSE